MDPVTTPTVHIVGGGIGGLAVAIGLHRRGFDVHVHEAAPSYAHVGGGHWLYANALHALDQLEPTLRADLVALGRPFDGFRFATRAGTTLFFETTRPYTPRPELAPVVLHRSIHCSTWSRRRGGGPAPSVAWAMPCTPAPRTWVRAAARPSRMRCAWRTRSRHNPRQRRRFELISGSDGARPPPWCGSPAGSVAWHSRGRVRTAAQPGRAPGSGVDDPSGAAVDHGG